MTLIIIIISKFFKAMFDLLGSQYVNTQHARVQYPKSSSVKKGSQIKWSVEVMDMVR